MTWLAYVLAVLAIVTMGANVYYAFRLKRSLSGGEVGQKWGLLTFLILFFFFGYLVSPVALLLELPPQVLNLLVFGVFFGGAVFVFVVIGVLRDVLGFLKLLK